MGKNQLRCFLSSLLIWAALCSVLLAPGQLVAEPVPPASDEPSVNQRYVVAAPVGAEQPTESRIATARCVLDKKTSLTWEGKTRDSGVQDANQTYSWYDPDKLSNGGFPGYRGKGICNIPLCDTRSYIETINRIKLCGRANWRLPSREELRSLVDYGIAYPGPTIDRSAFPNTVSQFYWSSTASANDNDTAWGIGFSFGYDYAYFKSDHGYIRLVSGPAK